MNGNLNSVFLLRCGNSVKPNYSTLSSNEENVKGCNQIDVNSNLGKEIIFLMNEGKFIEGVRISNSNLLFEYTIEKIMSVSEWKKTLLQVQKPKQNDHITFNLSRVIEGNSNFPKETPIEIYEYLKSRGVEHLIHITPIENINSIIKYGICSLNEQIKNNIKSLRPDKDRFDNQNDFNSCSISFPNYKYKYYKEQNNCLHFAVILLDIELLKEFKTEEIMIAEENAAKNKFAKSITELFKDIAHNKDTGRKCSRDELKLPSYYTTNPQSEILIKHCISKKYFKAIYINPDYKTKANELNIQSSIIHFDTCYDGPRVDKNFWNKELQQAQEEEGQWEIGLPF